MGRLLLGKEYFPSDELYSISKINYISNFERIKRLKPGDLLLVKTPGVIYRLGRKITKNIYDHIAVVLYNNETLNIVVPETVIRPTSLFSKSNRIPLILRPKWVNVEQKKKFIYEMEKFRNIQYNSKKTIIGVFINMIYSRLGIKIKIKKLDRTAKRWICTEAILLCLMEAFPEFSTINTLKLDYNEIGFATTNDFLRITEKFPELLEVIK
jgi:hypothetical protein